MRKWFLVIIAVILSLSLIITGACSTQSPQPSQSAQPAQPQSAADYYAKNTVELIVGYAAGGGVDYGARLFASFWSDVVPGGTMVVKNVDGAGGIAGVNKVYSAKPDGLTMGMTVMEAGIAPWIFKDPAAQFDGTKIIWIGLIGQDPYVMAISSKLPYTTLDQIKSLDSFKFGTAALNGASALGEALIAETVPIKGAKIVTGYSGSIEAGLAAGRGEVDGYVFGAASTNDDIKKGFVKKPFIVIDRVRSAMYPDTPTLLEVTKLTPQQETNFSLFVDIAQGRPLFFPPGVSDDKVKFVRDAFDKIVLNEGFLKQAKLRWTVWEKPIPGQNIAPLVTKVASIPEADVAAFRKLSEKYASQK